MATTTASTTAARSLTGASPISRRVEGDWSPSAPRGVRRTYTGGVTVKPGNQPLRPVVRSDMRTRLVRSTLVGLGSLAGVIAAAAPAGACGGLVGENGSISLVRTTTLAAWHDGIEHYVTSFEFAGDGSAVGSIVPLPGVPTDVVAAGQWTLQ